MLSLRPQYGFVKRLPAHARVVDIGCSNFERFHRYVGRYRSDLTVLGIEKYIDRSIYGERLVNPPGGARGPAYERFACDIELEDFPFADGSIDAVYYSHVIEHLTQQERVYREITRVLRPGGIVYVETPGEVSTSFKRPSGLLPGFGGTINYYDDPTHLGSPLTLDQIVRDLRRFGFECVSSGPVREFGVVGMPLYALMAFAGRLLAGSKAGSALYGAGQRNFLGFANYVTAVKRSPTTAATAASASLSSTQQTTGRS